MPNACSVPAYPAHAEQNGSSAVRPGTPVGSGTAVVGTVPLPRAGASAGGSDEVGAAEEPADAHAANSAMAIVNHPHRLDVTRRS